MRKIKLLSALILFGFLLPTIVFSAWWAVQDRPASWRNARWDATGLLPDADIDKEAAIYVLAARTGGMKGALAVHSWIVLKAEGGGYERYEKVGWGEPIRKNAYPADGRWYSNAPYIVRAVVGTEAERLLPKVREAIAAYPYAQRGAYRLWPGPNSNSFVAYVTAHVAELRVALPPNAIGRDYRPGIIAIDHDADWSDWHLSLGGYLGLGIGRETGLELNFLGLVAGFDFLRPALKLPGFGRIDLWSSGSSGSDHSSHESPAMEKPPSTTSVWPVTAPASGETR